MPLKFAANLHWLFTEIPTLAARYGAARQSGFRAVECGFPYDTSPDVLAEARREAGLEQVLINAPTGKAEGDFGLAAVPGRQQDFRDSLEQAVRYAKALDCPRIHVLSGKLKSGVTADEMTSVYKGNLRYAADRLQRDNIVALIEPINSRLSVPGYFMNNVYTGLAIVKEINHPNLRLQLDLFHAQILHGDLTNLIETCLPFTGHIQIAQVPDRHEPDSAGEINFDYVFGLLQRLGYEGYIGLEYKPSSSTEQSLQWLNSLTTERVASAAD